mgnify:CR=1 FL=1
MAHLWSEKSLLILKIEMKEIQQIKMRKDIQILKNEYRISLRSLAKTFEVTERTLREFFEMQRNLSDLNFLRINQGLDHIKKEIINAENYRGFND